MTLQSLAAALSGLMLVALQLFANPVDPSSDGYPRASWTQAEGISLTGVTSITQDHEGYIWLGTGAGLLRFDGARFVRWETLGPPLPQTSVVGLAPSKDGGVWVAFGNSGGVSHIDSLGSLQSYSWRDGLPAGPILAVLEDYEGTLWVGGFDGLARLRNGHWERFGQARGISDGASVSRIFEDRRGVLWVVSQAGLFGLDRPADMFERYRDGTAEMRAIEEDVNGAIWAVDAVQGVRRIAPGPSGRTTDVATRLSGGTVLLKDRQGYLWIGSDHGLFNLRHQDWGLSSALEPVASVERSAANSVLALFEDREGSIWVGTSGGLTRLAVTTTSQVTFRPEFVGMQVSALAADRDGSVWIATSNGLNQITANESRWYREAEGLPSKVIRALHADGGGRLWVATDRGVAWISKGQVRLLAGNRGYWMPDDLYTGTNILNRVVAITSDTQGRLWLCDYTGLYQWKDGVLLDLRGDVGRRTATAVLADSQGRTWVGFTVGGAVVHYNGRFQTFSTADGLPDAIVTAFYEDRAGDIWVATTSGLAKYENGRFWTVTMRNGLPDDAITAMTEAKDGRVWLGSRVGLVRLDSGELQRAVTEPSYRLAYTLFDVSDGFTSLVSSGSPTVIRTEAGALWFVSRDGISLVEPERLREIGVPPRVKIERLVADEVTQMPLGSHRLAPRTRRIQLEYTSLSFVAPSKLRFRYMLHGFDRDWIIAGGARQAYYMNLPPGEYRFQVAASNVGGTWTEPTELQFSIQPPFYRTMSFYLGSFIVALVTLFAVSRMHARRLQRKYALVLAERARVGREIHDTLLQGMVGVALQLQGIAETLNPAAVEAKPRLERARDFLEHSIRETRSSIWRLRSAALDTRDLPSALREAAETIVGPQVAFRLTVLGKPVRASQRVEEHVLKIAQEAIFNAVQHANPKGIDVQLNYRDDSLSVRISDDGQGFDSAKASDHMKPHWGLQTMRERAQHIGSTLRLHSGGAGTVVELDVNLGQL
jgi:ligand-binding sensor domain-containing protein/signal transduction histidine kinase